MRRFWIAVLLVTALLLGACGGPSQTEDPATSAPEETEAPTEASESVSISVAGSTTVQPLAELFAEAYMEMHDNVTIDIQGGGSSVGVKSAGQDTVDVGMASRVVKDSELEEFPELQPFAIAFDGIAVAVHPDVPVEEISLDDVKAVFAGDITNWSELGGPDANITVVSREEGSGTRAAFEDMVMGDDAVIVDTAILQPSNGSVRTTVASTPESIGYLSFGYLDDTTKALKVDGVAPSAENAANGSYPVVRPLNMMTNGAPSDAVQGWVDFILSDEGQAIVAEEGYIPVTDSDEGESGETEEEEAGLSGEISVAGSTTVQPLAELFAEAFREMYPDVTIDVQGGGSSVGVKSAAQGTVDVGMASREVKDSEMEEFPELQPFPIAFDGIAVAVHPDVPVDDISLADAQAVFAGEITNWSELGGPDANIIVVSREEGSGTRAAFEDMVMGEEVIVDTAILQPSNGSVRTTVASTPESMGYLSFGYLDDTTKALSVDGVEPSAANAANGSYPVVRPLNMMTNGEPGDLVQAWFDFILSAEGQAIVADEGYIAIE
jgi:phosphate transport system substrate-binding protein